MPNEAGSPVTPLLATPYHLDSGIDNAEMVSGYGDYKYSIPAQDQIVAYVAGMKISGTFTKVPNDCQSDFTNAVSDQSTRKDIDDVTLSQLIQNLKKSLVNLRLKSDYSSNTEELFEPVAVLEPVKEQETDATTDDISQWSSDKLALAIMDTEAETDMPRLREMILIAEDTGFTVDQSERLSRWLLNFAQKYCDSDDPQDGAVVLSAIRTGASMLHPNEIDCLRPLLKPGHSIETSLVTVKMLGRIFEAQPPVEVDEYQALADEVYQMADSLLNRYAITASQNAAMAQLAIYALAAMASSKIEPTVNTVKELDVTWFTRRTLYKFRDLRDIWASHSTAVRESPCQLLNKALQTLE